MILSDASIRACMDAGRILIHPLAENALQPSGVDLRLGERLKIATPDGFRNYSLLDDGPLRLHRHDFLLAATLEWIEIPDDLVGVLVGRSTVARRGIQIEAAGYVDSGWRGVLTLEIVMLSPMPTVLRVGDPIAQIRFERMTTAALRPYGSDGLGSHYQGSRGPVEAHHATP